MDSRDDFRVFEGSEHMFFGLHEPFAMVRAEVESGLRQQVPDTEIEHIRAYGEPKFLTVGHKQDDTRVVVTAFAICFRAELALTYDGGAGRETIDSTLTFLFREVDTPHVKRSAHFDLHADAARTFDDEVFKQRFLAFRYGEVDRA